MALLDCVQFKKKNHSACSLSFVYVSAMFKAVPYLLTTPFIIRRSEGDRRDLLFKLTHLT